MSLLQTMVTEKTDDLSRLPKEVLSKIRSNIRKGAENLEQRWANALELVHRAYEVEGVERPDPSMETAWKQYEETLQYAVAQLASNRGMEGDWRMSSSMFNEARQQRKYTVKTGTNEKYIVEATKLDDIIEGIKQQTRYDVLVEKQSSSAATIRFSRFGIRKNATIQITEFDACV